MLRTVVIRGSYPKDSCPKGSYPKGICPKG